MADEKEEVKKGKSKELETLKSTKDSSVDWPVEVVSQDGDKFHENDVHFDVGHKKAIELVKLGRVSLSKKGKDQLAKLEEDGYVTKAQLKGILGMLLFLFLFTFGVSAQTSVYADMKNTTYSTLLTDTVTNGGTGSLTSIRIAGGASSVTIFAILTELSGTTAGTLTVLGSLDGTNYKAIPTTETQTAMATATATDVASQSFTWHLRSSPYLYYRLQWVGAGTMSATMAAKILKH